MVIRDKIHEDIFGVYLGEQFETQFDIEKLKIVIKIDCTIFTAFYYDITLFRAYAFLSARFFERTLF